MAGLLPVATVLGCNPVSHRSCVVMVRGRSRVRYEKYGGEIFTDYYFGEANTANKPDNHHNNAINENLNWGGISGLLQLATTNRGSRPEIQDDLEVGEGEEKRETTISTPPTRDSAPCQQRTSVEIN